MSLFSNKGARVLSMKEVEGLLVLLGHRNMNDVVAKVTQAASEAQQTADEERTAALELLDQSSRNEAFAAKMRGVANVLGAPTYGSTDTKPSA